MATAEGIWSKGLDSVEAQHLLARAQAMQPTNLWIGVADAQGVVRTAIGGMLVGQSVSERPWFQKGLEQLHVGDVHPAKLLESLLPPLASGDALPVCRFRSAHPHRPHHGGRTRHPRQLGVGAGSIAKPDAAPV